MIFHFPDLDTLRLALTSGIVPPTVSLAAAQAGFEADGSVWVLPAGVVPRTLPANLRKLGVTTLRSKDTRDAQQVSSWLQVLPLLKDAGTPQLASSAPVLFELPDSRQLPVLVGEMLRLGNDRQGYRWLVDESSNEEDAGTVLLRVIGPPYYSLLRAIEALPGPAGEPAVRAYVERAPRVWVEIGYSHPLAEQIRPPEGKIVLMRPPCVWTFLDDTPFHDIYEVLEFALPEARVEHADQPMAEKLNVPLRLALGNANDDAELWVVRENPVEQLDALVRESDERLLARLSFAVGEVEGQKSIVVRVRPSKQPPPQLGLAARRFRSFWKLPNLFVPCGTRLQPPLRRDAVRKLLADDPATVTWLYPAGEEGEFRPETLPDTAFRPLEDWVDYVLDHDRSALGSWMQSAQFDFESFICKDEQPDKPEKPKGGGGRGRRGQGDSEAVSETDLPVEPQPERRQNRRAAQPEDDEFSNLKLAKPTELQKQLSAAEKKFLEVEGPLDDVRRQALWPELAALNTALEQSADAALCWTYAVWEEQGTVPGSWLAGWLRAETKQAPRDVTPADIDRLLAIPSPAPGEVRALVALLLWGAARTPAAPAVVQKLPQIQRFIEAHEPLLSVRSAWLAAVAIARLSGNDVLGLARARERLLERLYSEGLNAERDLPTFLRFAGQRDSERVRVVRDRAARLHQLARKWGGEHEVNAPYFDLMFAFGQARFGEASQCRELVAQATEAVEKLIHKLGKKDDVHSFLLDAFKFRIEQVLAGKPHGGPLPPEQLEYLESMEKMPRYIVDRMREQSWVLEPQEKFDPYRQWKKHNDELVTELSALPDLRERGQLADRIRQLLKGSSKKKSITPEERLLVLAESLPLAQRVGEAFTVELLDEVIPAANAVPSGGDPEQTRRLVQLLERALFLAAHFDRVEQVQQLVARFGQMLSVKAGGKPDPNLIAQLAGECLRSLRKLGLRDEIHRLLNQMSDAVLQGQPLAQVRAKAGAQWPDTLKTLLHLAGGWLYFGWVDQAMPVLDEARLALYPDADQKERLSPLNYTDLVRTYVTALGQAAADVALPRIEELFKRMERLPNSFTTHTHYSRLHVNVVEAVVRAIASDDFALGPSARRWLDEDEYLVRRRIHADMRAMQAQSGWHK